MIYLLLKSVHPLSIKVKSAGNFSNISKEKFKIYIKIEFFSTKT